MIPVVLFAFRRPDLLRQTLASLCANHVPYLIAFSDGPRTPNDYEAVRDVRSILNDISWCRVEICERPTNLGLGRSVREGVDRVLATHEMALVWEEDLVCVPGTYAYLTAALEHYAGDGRVMSVTGWTHPSIVPAGLDGQPYFDGKASCWVWGTWRRAWVGMHRTPMDIMRHCAEIGIDVEQYGTDMPKLAAEAEPRNLWAIGWWYHHLLFGGLCLRPPWSLTEHIGWDDRATTNHFPEALTWRNPPLGPCPPIPNAWPRPNEHPGCARLWRAAVGDPPTPVPASGV